MNFKIILNFAGLFYAGLMVYYTGNCQAADPSKLTESESKPTLYEEQSSQTPTVFGGVGRKLPIWEVGLDLLILGTPHYEAFRNQLDLSNRVFWTEWWYDDDWGIKGFHAVQSFRMFSSIGSSAISNTKNMGVIAKTRHLLTESLIISAGFGLGKTEYSLARQKERGDSLVSEFRMGIKISEEFCTEIGVLIIDSSSGSESEDQRLGSTSYFMGFSYGF